MKGRVKTGLLYLCVDGVDESVLWYAGVWRATVLRHLVLPLDQLVAFVVHDVIEDLKQTIATLLSAALHQLTYAKFVPGCNVK